VAGRIPIQLTPFKLARIDDDHRKPRS
jgi:hypothetical protein